MSWFAVDCDLPDHPKLLELPTDSARYGWIVTLARAKRQQPPGRFRSEVHYRGVLHGYAKHLPHYLAVGLLERDEEGGLLVHDWGQYQRDPTNALRQQRYRERYRERHARVTSAVTANVTVTPPSARAYTATATETVGESTGPSAVENSLPRALARQREGARPQKVEGFATPGEIDWHQTLDRRQLEAWGTFDQRWGEFKAAWLARGFRHPPAGSSDDDPETEQPSQRALLHSILDARPSDLPRWIAEAPRRATVSGVIGYVLAQWHAQRDEATGRAAEEETRWNGAQRVDAETAPAALAAWELDDLGQPMAEHG